MVKKTKTKENINNIVSLKTFVGKKKKLVVSVGNPVKIPFRSNSLRN